MPTQISFIDERGSAISIPGSITLQRKILKIGGFVCPKDLGPKPPFLYFRGKVYFCDRTPNNY